MNKKRENVFVRVDKNTGLFSAPYEDCKNAEDLVPDVIVEALTQLSELENNEKLREHAIKNGKAIIRNWSPPTDEQIDKILFNMREELLA
jgi:hypothetical protein